MGNGRNGISPRCFTRSTGASVLLIVLEAVMVGAGAFTENFRSALNGFNRADVVQFIQRQTVEYEKSMRLLREENARLKQAAVVPAENAEQLRAEKQEVVARLTEYQQKCAALQEEIRVLTAETQELKSALATATAEAEAAKTIRPQPPMSTLDRPIAPPARMGCSHNSFDEMELAAYRRAEQTERMARERAAAASERIQSVFRQTESKMNLTASDMVLLMENLRSNYDQMQTLMTAARCILEESAESLKVSAELSGVV